jgi:hypothetical protein
MQGALEARNRSSKEKKTRSSLTPQIRAAYKNSMRPEQRAKPIITHVAERRRLG